ncbi:MAG: glycoside hydrolase family 3 N-terminal domain-containing protein [Aggregatilineales bacterium]
MTPEERVGQLFLVSFYGSDIGPGSDIAELITDYHVGGVVLLPENGNFTADTPLPEQIYAMTSQLQRLAAAREDSLPEAPAAEGTGEPTVTPEPTAPAVTAPDYIPLFIAVEHNGAGSPDAGLLTALSPLPSNMAIGATWRPDFAEATGRVVGQQLSTLGVNMVLGPPADVLQLPQPTAPGDLGASAFGGEPVWVSEMTMNYVRGLHIGSDGRLAVIPRYFPGSGDADRRASDEIPTVRRTLDQLRQSDLLPFFAVTGRAPDVLTTADGVLVGHIRYQGFQGDNFRATTKPISLDPLALSSLMQMEEIASWRSEGGLLVTDALGLRGVRRYYLQGEGQFPARSIVRDAFGAGNDILYLGNFGNDPPNNQTSTIIDTINFFVSQYESDPAFQAQVDTSVRRILAKKLDLYQEFSLNTVLPDEEGLASIGQSRELTFNIARTALTLLQPSQTDLLTSPERGEQILIFTDTRLTRACPDCEEQEVVPVDALRSKILQYYGPQATGIVSVSNIQAFSFAELSDYLQFGPRPIQNDNSEQEGEEVVDQLGVALANADWIVFLMHDAAPDVAGTDVVKRFLASAPANPNARLVVFAMGAPYYLTSTTEVSKLTAYYALYGYTEPFIDVAARALFLELPPGGAPPVSVQAIGYDIFEVTEPNPNQVINLSYAVAGEEVEAGGTPVRTTVDVGDTLILRTGVIVDHNGRPVPDGTVVEFVLNAEGQGARTTQSETVDGIAEAMIVLEEGPGEVRISAMSGAARNSETVFLLVPETGSAEIDVLPPDITPTQAPTDTPEPTAEAPLIAAAETPEPQATQEPVVPRNSVDFGDLFLAVLGLLAIAVVVMLYGITTHDINYGLLLALPTILFGLLAYNYYALLLPGAYRWHEIAPDGWGAGLAAWIGGILGLILANVGVYAWNRWIVMALRNRQRG